MHVGQLARPDQRESFPGWWVGKKRNRVPWLKHCHWAERSKQAARESTCGSRECRRNQGGKRSVNRAGGGARQTTWSARCSAIDRVEAARAAASTCTTRLQPWALQTSCALLWVSPGYYTDYGGRWVRVPPSSLAPSHNYPFPKPHTHTPHHPCCEYPLVAFTVRVL